jgi:hypothetical protein
MTTNNSLTDKNQQPMKTTEEKLDKNGMPDTFEVGIYYYTDDDGKKVYDEECMREEFEAMLEFLRSQYDTKY